MTTIKSELLWCGSCSCTIGIIIGLIAGYGYGKSDIIAEAIANKAAYQVGPYLLWGPPPKETKQQVVEDMKRYIERLERTKK